MEVYTYEMVSNAFMVFLGCIGVVSLIASLVITFRAIKKPYDERNQTIREHSDKLDRDWSALQNLSNEIAIMLNGQMLLLQHEITGNHVEKLKEHLEFVQRYLIEHHSSHTEV